MDKREENFQIGAVSELIEDFRIKDLPQEKKDEMVIKMTESLLKRIFVEAMDRLGNDGRAEYKSMQLDSQPQQIEVFFREKIRGYDEMVEKIVSEFKRGMLRKDF